MLSSQHMYTLLYTVLVFIKLGRGIGVYLEVGGPRLAHHYDIDILGLQVVMVTLDFKFQGIVG